MLPLIMKLTTAILFVTLVLSLAAAGCGASNHDCNMTALSLSPLDATASHTAAAPGNQQQFSATPVLPSGCPIPPVSFFFATFAVSDTTNVSISNAQDQTHGTATCIGATPAPATVIATATNGHGVAVTGFARLTCN